MSPTKLWSSQYPVQNPGSRRIYLLQKVKGCRRGPAAMMRGSNMGILPYWPNILLITWGLLLHKAGSLFFFTSCVVTRRFCLKAASGLPLESFINITWGLGRVRTNATPFDRRFATRSLGDMVKSEPVMPLDRPKATESLGGLVEPEPLPRLLIGIMPRFHLGTWLTWTIATPLGSLVVSDHGNTIWSAQ